MANLKHDGYQGSVEASIEDGCLHGRVLFIDDLIVYEGETVPELVKNFQEAVERYVADCQASGKEPGRPYSGTFNVRVGPELHKEAAQLAARSGLKLNELVTQAIRAYVSNPDKIQVNHHHEHVVTVTLETNAMVASPQSPSDWQPIAPSAWQ